MKLTYLGHACFLLESDLAKKLLMDPFDDSMGYPVPSMPVDVVTISHAHHDHNDLSHIPNAPIVIREAGRQAVEGFAVEGIDSFHDAEGGAKRGSNVIFVVEVDGIRIAHLGDLGHALSAEQISRLGHIDVLLIPVGGYYTIDAEEALAVARAIAPRVAVPMHYAVKGRESLIQSEERFAAGMSAMYLDGNTLELSTEALKKLPSAIVLK